MCHGKAHSTAVRLKFSGVKEILFAKHYYIVWLIYFLDLSSASDMPTNKLGEKMRCCQGTFYVTVTAE